MAVSEQQAKEEAFVLCRIHAGYVFENLSLYDISIFWEQSPEYQEEKNGEST